MDKFGGLRILDLRSWIDSTDKSRGGYHQEIFGHNSVEIGCCCGTASLPLDFTDVQLLKDN